MLLQLGLVGSLALTAIGPGTPDTVSAATLLRPGAGVSISPLALPGAPLLPPHFADVGSLEWSSPAPPRLRAAPLSGSDVAPQLVEYSDGYFTRLTIHRWASYLMLPLFVSEYVVGQKLIGGDESMRGAHGAITGGIGGVFAVNTVTGGWNAIEAWHDPEGRTKRTIHSALMLLADAGFFLTASLANSSEDGPVSGSANHDHRRMAIISMSTATLGWLIMLPFFGGS